MNVVLNSEIEEKLKSRMKNGGFATPEDAIRAGLELLRQQETTRDFASGELQMLIAKGEQSIADEGTIDGDDAFEKRQRRRQAMRSKSFFPTRMCT